VIQWPAHPGLTVSGVRQLPRCAVALRWFRPGFALSNHTLDRTRMDITLRGSGWMRVGEEEHTAAPGVVTLRPGRLQLCGRVGSEGMLQFSLMMDSDLGLRRIDHHPGADSLLFRAYRAYARPDATTPLTLESLVAEIRAVLAGERDARADDGAWLARVVDRLRCEPFVTPSLDDLAADAGVHFTTVARGFRRKLRCTPGDYLRSIRLGLAAARLTRTEEPIARIAHDLGFADQSHLGRRFREVYGEPPAAYRRRFRRHL